MSRLFPALFLKEITGVSGNAVKVKHTAPPVEGEANEQLIDIISKRFKASKKIVSIIKGSASRSKTIKTTGVIL